MDIKFDEITKAAEEKRLVILPAGIGDTVYTYHLDCFDGCFFQKELFNEVFEKKDDSRCGKHPCHTKFHSVQESTVSLSNIAWLLDTWERCTFATAEQAKEAAEKKILENKAELIRLGFKLDSKGYSIINRNDEELN